MSRISTCICGHERPDHYRYIRNGRDTSACKGCDPFNKGAYRDATNIAVEQGTYAEAMHEAMNHEFEEVPPA